MLLVVAVNLFLPEGAADGSAGDGVASLPNFQPISNQIWPHCNVTNQVQGAPVVVANRDLHLHPTAQ